MPDFNAPNLMLVGLAEITLPTKTIRLCDGAFIYMDGNKFTSSDDEFGSIEAVDAIDERAGDEAPAGRLTFLPSSTAAAATLSQPSFQGSPLKFWMGRVNPATGELDGTPELIFDGELDTTTLRVGKGVRALDMEFISIAERLFNIEEGNVLSPRHHKSVWPGELGMDNTTGISTIVPWGIESPPRTATHVGSGQAGAREAFMAVFR